VQRRWQADVDDIRGMPGERLVQVFKDRNVEAYLFRVGGGAFPVGIDNRDDPACLSFAYTCACMPPMNPNPTMITFCMLELEP